MDGAAGREPGGHRVEPGDGVGPRLVDALVAVVVVDRVGHQEHRGVAVVDDGEVGGQAERQLRRRASPRAAGSPGAPSGARRPSRGRRRARRSAAGAPAAAGWRARRGSRATATSGSPSVGTPAGGVPIQSRRAVLLREHGGGAGTDDGVARPDAPVVGGLQQEGARRVTGELAVDPDRRLGVGEELADHRARPAGLRASARKVASSGQVAPVSRSGAGPAAGSAEGAALTGSLRCWWRGVGRRSRCGRRCGRRRRSGRR